MNAIGRNIDVPATALRRIAIPPKTDVHRIGIPLVDRGDGAGVPRIVAVQLTQADEDDARRIDVHSERSSVSTRELVALENRLGEKRHAPSLDSNLGSRHVQQLVVLEQNIEQSAICRL